MMSGTKALAKIFKAYDIRGRYPEEINEENVACIVEAYSVFIKPKTVIVGRDVRTSGPALFKVARDTFRECGIDVIDIGVVPVDVFYFAGATWGSDGGLFISASHNPREWNGLNFIRRGAEPISSESGLRDIYNLAVSGLKLYSHKKGILTRRDPTEGYLDFVMSHAHLPRVGPMKVVVNGNFGVSAQLFRRLVARAGLPLTLFGLNDKADGTFPKGPPNPLLPENREETRELIVKEKADFGIAWDADGDRCFFFDENGNFIEGYFIVALLSQEILRREPKSTILIDPRLVWATEDVGRALGGRIVVSRPGMTLIAERMRKEGAVFAGEMSSHFYFRETFYRDNGFLPALMILGIVSREGKKLSEVVAPFTQSYFISGELNFEIHDQAAVLRRVEDKYKGGAISRIDGLSVEYSGWRFNLRASNTEPLLRLNVEARDREILETEVKRLRRIIEE